MRAYREFVKFRDWVNGPETAHFNGISKLDSPSLSLSATVSIRTFPRSIHGEKVRFSASERRGTGSIIHMQ